MPFVLISFSNVKVLLRVLNKGLIRMLMSELRTPTGHTDLGHGRVHVTVANLRYVPQTKFFIR